MINDLVLVKEDIKIDIPWPLVNHLLAAHGVLDVLELVQKVEGIQGCLDLFRVSLLAIIWQEILPTSQAPLTKRSWSVTYMGSVSHRLLVRLTLMPLASISRHALSISAMRSPRLLPKAM